MRVRALIPLVLALGVGVPPAFALTVGSPEVAALQVGLSERSLYHGTIDGLVGPRTRAAARVLRRRAGLPAGGLLEARLALGPYGQRLLGSRTLAEGMSGWDVAELQFLLAWHGFPTGYLTGVFGAHTEAALLRFQHWSGLPLAGVMGPLTLAALRAAPPRSPIALAWPLRLPVGDPFGPRGDRFHAGIDIPAALGTPVAAARAGRVVWAGPRDGWGNLVTVAHGGGVRTLYAHLSRIDVRLGQRVSTGTVVGLVGATGDATGPHLHFEVRLRGAAVDPMTALSR